MKTKNGHPQKDDPTGELWSRHAALKGEEYQIGAAADSELAEKIGDVKFYGALGNVQLAGDFLVGEILEK